MTAPTKEQEAEAEAISRNFETFKAQTAKIGGERAEKLLRWLGSADGIDSGIIMAPASTRLEYVCAYPGGLVEHSLRVLQTFAKLRKALDLVEKISVESVVIASLYHDLGKVGTEKQGYYTECTSQWHRDKLGQMYNINDSLRHWQPTQLSLFRLGQLGVALSENEWVAIASVGAPRVAGEDAPTPHSEPILAVVLQQAVKHACILGKNKKNATVIA